MNWNNLLALEFNKSYFLRLKNYLIEERKKYLIYPPKGEVFKAFELTPFERVKVVIIGQDPYHNEGEAHGLAFSVKEGKIPPSLKNIFKELESDLNIKRNNSSLEGWAKEGVLLLNTILTVRKNAPLSHLNQGWERFSLEVIKILNYNKENLVFILWGNNAKRFSNYINQDKHLIISSSHPSPLSARVSFFGSHPFSKTNDYLIKSQKAPIDWSK
ncbi:MAG: uracil-DNA glycosylase [Acholeplasmataceae bacterium]|nr:uracil-DNA glycosylase [Acholeplasmataceae bacterium]